MASRPVAAVEALTNGSSAQSRHLDERQLCPQSGSSTEDIE